MSVTRPFPRENLIDLTIIDRPEGRFFSHKDCQVPKIYRDGWQKTIDLASELIDVPVSIVTRIQEDEIEVFLSSNSQGNPLLEGMKEKLKWSYCEKVIKTRDQVIVPNAIGDPEWENNPDIDLNLIAYLGLPLYWPSGEIFGTLCVFDTQENNFSPKQQKFLQRLQQTILSDLALLEKMKELEETKRILGELNRDLAEKSIILECRSEELLLAKEDAESARLNAEKAKKNAVKSNEMKSTFLTNMSHELRTPLNAILGFSQLLQSSKKYPLVEKQRRFVKRIHSSGEHLLALINDILELSKIESGKFDLKTENILISTIFENCKDVMTPTACQQGIKLNFELSDKSLSILCDFTRFKQVILNLCSNAIKYNKENGQVTLMANQHDATTVRISVRDTGVGIEDDQKEKIFEAFNRLGAENSKIEGTGIGMSITKNLVEKMKGKLSFTSEIGVGSIFHVDMPSE